MDCVCGLRAPGIPARARLRPARPENPCFLDCRTDNGQLFAVAGQETGRPCCRLVGDGTVHGHVSHRPAEFRRSSHKMKKALTRLLAKDVSLLREAFPALSFTMVNGLSRLVKVCTVCQAHAGLVSQPDGKPRWARAFTWVQDTSKASRLSRHQPFKPSSRIKSCITTARQ